MTVRRVSPRIMELEERVISRSVNRFPDHPRYLTTSKSGCCCFGLDLGVSVMMTVVGVGSPEVLQKIIREYISYTIIHDVFSSIPTLELSRTPRPIH